MSKIEQIKGEIEKLPTLDVLSINDFVAQLIHAQALQVALAKRAEARLKSPCQNCGFICLVRWGASKAGTQRFKCRNCKATFGATNDTPFFRLRKRHL